jgi:hypothetical protein
MRCKVVQIHLILGGYTLLCSVLYSNIHFNYYLTNYQIDFLFAEYFSYLDEYKFQLFYYYYDLVILVYMCELTFDMNLFWLNY